MGHFEAAFCSPYEPRCHCDPAVTDFAAPELDLSHNRAPIYVQLSTLFRRFIVTGHWPVDKQVPTHETLAVQFDVNPATIRKAIAMLEGEGLVKRRRRHGTFVTAKPASADWFRIGATWSDAIASYDGLSFDQLAADDLEAIAEPFHSASLQAVGYRHLRRLYRRAGVPIMIEDSYLDQALRRKIGDSKLSAAPVLALLDRDDTLRIERADETVRFGIADTEISAVLRIALNAAVTIIHYSVYGENSKLQYESCAYLRGDIALISEPIKFVGAVR
jgi:GntR family transcriptional regulator